MLRIENLTKTFLTPPAGEVKALDAVSLSIRDGELVAVVGPSGSGKSTLLFAAGGLAAPTSGEIWIGETRVYGLDVEKRAALRRSEVGFVFQTFNLVPYLTCWQNIALPAILAGKSRTDASEVALRVLERLGMTALRDRLPAQLSVGERQRAGVGRALVNNPRLLLADEPTGNLDPTNADQVMRLFQELNGGGQTIVMVTHDPRLSAQARRVIHLRGGRVEEDSGAAIRSAAP